MTYSYSHQVALPWCLNHISINPAEHLMITISEHQTSLTRYDLFISAFSRLALVFELQSKSKVLRLPRVNGLSTSTCLQPDPAYFIEHFMVGVQCLAQGHFSGGNFNVPVGDTNRRPSDIKTAPLTSRPSLPQDEAVPHTVSTLTHVNPCFYNKGSQPCSCQGGPRALNATNYRKTENVFFSFNCSEKYHIYKLAL